jgi:hypothetical protein
MFGYTLIDIDTGLPTNRFPHESIFEHIEPLQVGGYLSKGNECYEVIAIHQEELHDLISVYVRRVGSSSEELLEHIRSTFNSKR